jgi:hypothetical protein
VQRVHVALRITLHSGSLQKVAGSNEINVMDFM